MEVKKKKKAKPYHLTSRHHVPHQKWKIMDVLDESSEVMLVFMQHRKSLLSTVKHSWKSPVWPYIYRSIFITAVLPCSLLVLQLCCFTKPPLIWQSAFVPHFHGSQSCLFSLGSGIILCSLSIRNIRICLLLMCNCCNLNGKISSGSVRKPCYLQDLMERDWGTYGWS